MPAGDMLAGGKFIESYKLEMNPVEISASSRDRSELTCAPKGDMPAAGRLDESGEVCIKQTSQRPDMRP